MAKKKTRKSRRARRRSASTAQARPAKEAKPASAKEASPPAAASPSPAKARGIRRATTDFINEYSYVYFDLRKMFTIAFIMFVFLVVTNLVLTRLVTL